MLTALIMAGGIGQRFWPLSSEKKPKQLLKLLSDKSMIRETVDRILPIISADRIFIATNVKQIDDIKNELPFIPDENIIIEPLFKDTAAAIGFGASYIDARCGESVMIVLASDHTIKDEVNFKNTLLACAKEAENGSIITLGIKPNKPETGYGYIEVENKIELETIMNVKSFKEKPDLNLAKQYIELGNYLWNSGMFIFKTSTIIKEIEKYLPNHYSFLESCVTKIEDGKTGKDLSNAVIEEFSNLDKISIDFGIMEKSEKIKVMPVDFGWNDVGAFTSLEEVLLKNDNGTINKNANLVEVNSRNNIVISTSKKLIATFGLEDIIIVDTEDGLLLCKKSEAQNIKEIFK